MNLKEMQKEILQNKINKGFNTTDINKEFCLLYGEKYQKHMMLTEKIKMI